ncbi:hypothetical protein GF351_01500 [Candidatus Woesearchaeota archaeon]|nr:hypothetical protein [Candidatus Woesearchaeota archaeon]
MIGPPYKAGMSLESVVGGLALSGRWDVEKNKSSVIDIIPDTGIIRKEKSRKLDKMVYEVFSSLFLAELLKIYTQILSDNDFTLFSPQTLRFEYGEEGDKTSRRSVIYQVFCPGSPFSKIRGAREDNFQVRGEYVRVEQRAAYVSGILKEVMKKEGIVHGDPEIRHFFLLPKSARLRYYDSEDVESSYESKNGVGVIDCENLTLQDSRSRDTARSAEEFRRNVLTKFFIKECEEYFNKGSKLVCNECPGDEMFRQRAYSIAKNIFDQRFQTGIVDIDMQTRKIQYF